MRRVLGFLAVVAIVASSCGSATDVLEAAVEPAPADSDVDVATTTTTTESETETSEAIEETPRTGRESILANHTEGKPYVLWYWGAH